MVEDPTENKQTHVERVGRKPRQSPLSQDREDALIWLAYETANVSREAQLRIQDATEFVERFSQGKLSHEDFKKRRSAYWNNWHDALGGVADSRGMTDEEVYKDMANIKNRVRGLPER